MLRHLQTLQPRMASRAVLSAVQAASLAKPSSTPPSFSAALSSFQLSSASQRTAKLILSFTGAASLQFERRFSDNVKASFTRGGVRSFSSSSVASLKAGDSFEGKTTSGMFAIKKRLATSNALDKAVPYDEVMEDLHLNQATTTSQSQANKYQQFQLTLATCQALAANKGKPLTLGFVLDNFEAERSAFWRILTWSMVYGKPDEVVQLLTKKQRVLAELMTHFAVGGPKAERYYDAGLRTTEDLASAPSDKVERPVRLGAQHHKDLLQFVPLSEANEWRELINEAVDASQTGLQFELVDGPRRGELLSKDIYVVAWHPDVERAIEKGGEAELLLPGLINELKQLGLVVEQLSSGPNICKALVRAPPGEDGVMKPVRRLEINFTINPGVALLAQTGNAAFLQAVRKRAKALGLTVDEQGFWPASGRPKGSSANETLFRFNTEREVFEFLGLEYLKPEERCKMDYEAWLLDQPTPKPPKLPTKKAEKRKTKVA